MSKIKNQMLEPQIVKIQQSIYSSDGLKSILVKNKDNSMTYQEKEPSSVNAILEILNGRDKAYFMVQVVVGKINILEEVENQKF